MKRLKLARHATACQAETAETIWDLCWLTTSSPVFTMHQTCTLQLCFSGLFQGGPAQAQVTDRLLTGYWQVTDSYWQLLSLMVDVDIEGVASPQVIAENSWFCPGVVFRHFVSIEMRWVPENFKPAKFCSDSWTWTPPVISLRRARRNTSFIGTVGAANHPTLLLDLRVNRFWYQCGWYDFCIGMICLSWDSSIPSYHILPCFCNNTCFGADWIIASVDSSDSSCKSVLDRAAFVDLATRKQVGRFQRMNQLVSLKTLDKQFALLLESTRRTNVTSCIQTPHELVQEAILKCLALNC